MLLPYVTDRQTDRQAQADANRRKVFCKGL